VAGGGYGCVPGVADGVGAAVVAVARAAAPVEEGDDSAVAPPEGDGTGVACAGVGAPVGTHPASSASRTITHTALPTIYRTSLVSISSKLGNQGPAAPPVGPVRARPAANWLCTGEAGSKRPCRGEAGGERPCRGEAGGERNASQYAAFSSSSALPKRNGGLALPQPSSPSLAHAPLAWGKARRGSRYRSAGARHSLHGTPARAPFRRQPRLYNRATPSRGTRATLSYRRRRTAICSRICATTPPC